MTQVCETRFLISKGFRPFKSKSNPNKTYRVYAFRENELPFCDCWSFLRGRKAEAKRTGDKPTDIPWECTHTRQLFAETCDYVQTSTDQYAWDDKCPKCGGNLVDTDHVDMPEDREAQVDDLRALLDDLRAQHEDASEDPTSTPAGPPTGTPANDRSDDDDPDGPAQAAVQSKVAGLLADLKELS